MSSMLGKLQIIVEPERDLRENGRLITRLHIVVSRFGKDDLHIRRIIPDNDFESYWDYVWDVCKALLDAELKRKDKEF